MVQRFALASVFALSTTFALGCAPSVAPAASPSASPIEHKGGLVRAGTPAGVDIAMSRDTDKARLFAWAEFAPETFERAKREKKLILLDGAAEWCHWCHVMDETTYLDPAVGALLRDRFVTIRVDVDKRPDLAERYGAWGWPATIVFSPDAEEIGKYRGYIPAVEMKTMLEGALAAQSGARVDAASDVGDKAASVDALPWVAAHVAYEMDDYYDLKNGGWGRTQKTALGRNIEVELRRAAKGDKDALERARFALTQQRGVYDPVWGGVYQYSAAKDWSSPHYEKLMSFQAENLEATALAYAATKDKSFLEDARHIAGYLNEFLSNKEGAFLVSQDADVNAHDRKARFVDGDVYYRKGDAERRALGIPRIDDAVYPSENGLAIAAFVTLYQATNDAAALERAKKAADLMLARFVDADGVVRRDKEGKVRFLADAASLGRALVKLAIATHDPRYEERAKAIAAAMERDFGDAKTGAFFDRSLDPNAAGVFKERTRPFVHVTVAARFLATLGALTKDDAWTARSRKALAALATPRGLDERGRMVGDYLLALDEAGVSPW